LFTFPKKRPHIIQFYKKKDKNKIIKKCRANILKSKAVRLNFWSTFLKMPIFSYEKCVAGNEQ
jgi:hypothetical protein